MGEKEAAIRKWLEWYTWVQRDGSVNFTRGRVRPKGLPIHAKEMETINDAKAGDKCDAALMA